MRRAGISYRVDETYIKSKGVWYYLYRAIDSYGDTINFMLSPERSKNSACCFFHRALDLSYASKPKVINIDKNKVYPPALRDLKRMYLLDDSTKIRQSKYLNNIIELDHRFIKKLAKTGLWFQTPPSAWKTPQGYKTMHMIRKCQVNKVPKKNIQKETQFIKSFFGVTA